jgi:hypothetical protein
MKALKNYPFLALVLWGITVPSMLVLGLIAKNKYEYYFGFDRDSWQSKSYSLKFLRIDYPRQYMVQDVLAHELKVGMSKREVVELLGPPDDYYNEKEAFVIRYFSHINYSDSEYLTIKFDNERVTQSFIGR